jgi:hypothetical protein
MIMRGFNPGEILFYLTNEGRPFDLDLYKDWKGYTPDLELGREYVLDIDVALDAISKAEGRGA